MRDLNTGTPASLNTSVWHLTENSHISTQYTSLKKEMLNLK